MGMLHSGFESDLHLRKSQDKEWQLVRPDLHTKFYWFHLLNFSSHHSHHICPSYHHCFPKPLKYLPAYFLYIKSITPFPITSVSTSFPNKSWISAPLLPWPPQPLKQFNGFIVYMIKTNSQHGLHLRVLWSYIAISPASLSPLLSLLLPFVLVLSVINPSSPPHPPSQLKHNFSLSTWF